MSRRPAQLLEGIAQFNRGEYFEQHETLELLWRAEIRNVRRLYQGILQIGVAFHHLRRMNHHGAMYMLTRGPQYLAPFAPSCQGVDVARLVADAGAARAAVEQLGPARLGEFDWALAPTVHVPLVARTLHDRQAGIFRKQTGCLQSVAGAGAVRGLDFRPSAHPELGASGRWDAVSMPACPAEADAIRPLGARVRHDCLNCF